MSTPAAPRHPALMCRVEKIVIDFLTHRAVVHLPADNCVDAQVCVRTIQLLDRDVREIETIVGDLPGIIYAREGKAWLAIPPLPAFEWRPAHLWQRSC